MSNNINALEPWAKSLIKSLDPSSRQKMLRQIGLQLRRENIKRMTREVDPDGRKWPARKPRPKNGKSKPPKRGKMMRGLRRAKFLPVKANANSVNVGYTAQNQTTNNIARIHHYGLRERFGKRNIQYPKRPLLGISQTDQEVIADVVLQQIKPQ